MGRLGEEAALRLEREVASLASWAARLDDRAVHARPSADEWSVMECLAHADEFIPYWGRQAQVLAARERDGEPFGRAHDDPDRIAAVERGRREAAGVTLERIRAETAATGALLRAIPDERYQRSGRHPRRGEMTVSQLVDAFLVDHVAEHARQARAALGESAAPAYLSELSGPPSVPLK